MPKKLLNVMKKLGIELHFSIDFKEIEIKRVIGEGGFGTVFLAEWLGLNIAVKQFGKEDNTVSTKNFLKEI